jgi:hypothetical protein
MAVLTGEAYGRSIWPPGQSATRESATAGERRCGRAPLRESAMRESAAAESAALMASWRVGSWPLGIATAMTHTSSSLSNYNADLRPALVTASFLQHDSRY